VWWLRLINTAHNVGSSQCAAVGKFASVFEQQARTWILFSFFVRALDGNTFRKIGLDAMGYHCKSCSTWHEERPTCFGAELPEIIAGLPAEVFEARVRRSSDQCILDDEHFFILGNLDVPVCGTDEFVRWTIWTTLSSQNFERASALWDTVGRETEPPYFGWLSNQIPGYPPSINIKARVHTQSIGVRPQIEIVEPGHPLGVEQQSGVTQERADELIHASWHRT
jgi:hypothetical protein